MTTKAAALFSFFNRFMNAYPDTSVPEDASFPYLSYSPVYSVYGEVVSIAVNLWYKGESESVPNAKVDQISKAIGSGGIMIPCDGGAIWIKRGSPFAQAIKDIDNNIKRRYILLDVEYVTQD